LGGFASSVKMKFYLSTLTQLTIWGHSLQRILYSVWYSILQHINKYTLRSFIGPNTFLIWQYTVLEPIQYVILSVCQPAQHLSLVRVITVNVHLNRMSWNIRIYAERWSMGRPDNCVCILKLNWNRTIALSQQNSALLEVSSCPWLIKIQKSAYKRKHKWNLMFILFGVLGTVCKRPVLLYIWEDHSYQNMISHSHPTQFGP